MSSSTEGSAERILILAPTGLDGPMIQELFAAAGIEGRRCDGLPELLSSLNETAGAVVIAQEALDRSGAQQLLARLEAQEPWSDIPIILLTLSTTERAGAAHPAIAILERANAVLVQRPVRRQWLLSAVRSALRARGRQHQMRNLYHQLALARWEAESASRAKDEFLAVLGHELRNPLAPILTALQLWKLRESDGASRERAIIERQAQHLVRLVDDLLDVSRITRGKVELRKRPVEVAAVVARAVETASPLLEERHHHLSVEVPPRGMVVAADPERLAQVIANLLTNAAKYTEPGGRIAVRAAVADGQAAISVKDSGIGIDPSMLGQVFEMFVQEPQALDRRRGGLGLGLAIVRNLVAMHGGTVEAASEGRGQGSEFTVRLPLTQERAKSEPVPAPAVAPGHAEAAHGRRILVVDDNEDAAETLAEFLEVTGHAVRVAHDGPEALRAVAEFRPEIALLDLGLPVMDGVELARRLRSQPPSKDMRLVAVTGYGQEADVRRTREAGFDAHLVKPVDLEQVEAVIEGL